MNRRDGGLEMVSRAGSSTSRRIGSSGIGERVFPLVWIACERRPRRRRHFASERTDGRTRRGRGAARDGETKELETTA